MFDTFEYSWFLALHHAALGIGHNPKMAKQVSFNALDAALNEEVGDEPDFTKVVVPEFLRYLFDYAEEQLGSKEKAYETFKHFMDRNDYFKKQSGKAHSAMVSRIEASSRRNWLDDLIGVNIGDLFLQTGSRALPRFVTFSILFIGFVAAAINAWLQFTGLSITLEWSPASPFVLSAIILLSVAAIFFILVTSRFVVSYKMANNGFLFIVFISLWIACLILGVSLDYIALSAFNIATEKDNGAVVPDIIPFFAGMPLSELILFCLAIILNALTVMFGVVLFKGTSEALPSDD